MMSESPNREQNAVGRSANDALAVRPQETSAGRESAVQFRKEGAPGQTCATGFSQRVNSDKGSVLKRDSDPRSRPELKDVNAGAGDAIGSSFSVNVNNDGPFIAKIESLFRSQRYADVVMLCEGRHDLGGKVAARKRSSEAYLKIFEEYEKYCQNLSPRRFSSLSSKKSVYFLHSSLPYLSGGYATRAHGLILALREQGLDVRPYTRPNFPYDVKKGLSEKSDITTVDRVVYRKTFCKSVRLRDEASYMLECIDVFDRVIKKEKPAYVHGRSTYQIALPALIAARKNNLPFVYEVSGLWEIVHESRESAHLRRHETQKMRYLEALTARKADVVFTLTAAMKEELICRGVEESRIALLPNCTDPNRFVPYEKSQQVLDELKISAAVPVVGYVGSFQDYEGLDDLISACELLSSKNNSLDYRLLLVGDGPYFNEIRERRNQSKVKEKIILLGRVDNALVPAYYSVIDIATFPRKAWPVCEMVSPMKPLEALAAKKAVVVSSVKALAEMVIENKTGLVFQKGSVDDLSSCIMSLLCDERQRTYLGINAREWVKANRDWQSIASNFMSRLSLPTNR